MEIFKGAMLSSWNSLYGPKIEHLWLLNDHALHSVPKEKCVKIKNFDLIKDKYAFLKVGNCLAVEEGPKENFNLSSLIENIEHSLEEFKKYLRMSGKLLLTEMESKRPFMENSSRIYHLEDKILFSIVFYSRPLEESKELENMCLSMSFMLSCKDFKCTLKCQNIIELHLRKIAVDVKKLLLEKEEMATCVSRSLEDLCNAMNAVNENKDDLDQMQHCPRFSQFQLRAKFLGRSIVSHMETSGCSVIIGTSKFTVNQVAQILLLFNTKKEKNCSSPLSKNTPGICHRGLHVQGLIRDYTENQGLSLFDDRFNDSPITIIDTDSYKVRQSLDMQSCQTNRNSLKTVKDSGKLIPQFLQDLFLFEEHKWATTDIFNSMLRCIYIKATALIKIVERIRKEGSATTEKQAMALLNVSDVVDFKIYLGYAEKLKPGIKASVM